MNSIDTNIALRFLLNDDPQLSNRAKLVLSNPPIYLSDVVVTETVYVLEKSLGYPRTSVAALIGVLIAVPGLVYSDHLIPDVVKMYERKGSLSFVDCYAVIEARMFGAKLYTFDKKLIAQGGSHVIAP